MVEHMDVQGVPTGPARRTSSEVRSSEPSAEGGKRKFGGRPAVCREPWSAASRRNDLEFWLCVRRVDVHKQCARIATMMRASFENGA